MSIGRRFSPRWAHLGAVVAALALTGCGSGPVEDPVPPECRIAPSAAPARAIVAPDGVVYADLGEVAQAAGAVLTGRFMGEADDRHVDELFPDDALGPGSGLAYALWTFEPEQSVKGGVAADGAIQVMVPLWPTDAAGRVNDPACMGGARVVLMLDGAPVATALGDTFHLEGSLQFGAPFAQVSDQGAIIPQPRSYVPVPPLTSEAEAVLERLWDGEGSERDIADAVAAQLGLDG